MRLITDISAAKARARVCVCFVGLRIQNLVAKVLGLWGSAVLVERQGWTHACGPHLSSSRYTQTPQPASVEPQRTLQATERAAVGFAVVDGHVYDNPRSQTQPGCPGEAPRHSAGLQASTGTASGREMYPGLRA